MNMKMNCSLGACMKIWKNEGHGFEKVNNYITCSLFQHVRAPYNINNYNHDHDDNVISKFSKVTYMIVC